MVAEAEKRHAGQYTCKAVDGDKSISSKINLDVVGKLKISWRFNWFLSFYKLVMYLFSLIFFAIL